MKIVVLTGSPHKEGTTDLLADKFIEGAESKGHEIYRFDAAFRNIHPCLGCDTCGMSGPCVHKDDIENEAIQKLREADVIALVTPVYYFAFSAQLKTVIDRFYSRTYDINNKQSVLLAAAGSNTPLTMRSITKHYQTLAAICIGRIWAWCWQQAARHATRLQKQIIRTKPLNLGRACKLKNGIKKSCTFLCRIFAYRDYKSLRCFSVVSKSLMIASDGFLSSRLTTKMARQETMKPGMISYRPV